MNNRKQGIIDRLDTLLALPLKRSEEIYIKNLKEVLLDERSGGLKNDEVFQLNTIWKARRTKNVNDKDENNILFDNKTFVFTGFRSDEYTRKISTLGGTVVDKITRGIDYVVARNTTRKTVKIKTAEQYGIRVVSEEELKKQINTQKV